MLSDDARDDDDLQPPQPGLLPTSAPRARIGPYELETRIGAGGMGAVYLALRADGAFERRVALKLLHPGMHSSELVERFRRERQVQANLGHPCIAALLDGGATEEGTPYLVLEYVDGVRIDEYCDAGRLSIQQRLVLFTRVCSAVQHAHEQLVVHRDI